MCTFLALLIVTIGQAPGAPATTTNHPGLNDRVLELATEQLGNRSPWRFNGVGYSMVAYEGTVLVHGNRQFEVAMHPEMTFSECDAEIAFERREAELGGHHACGEMSSGKVMATSIEFWEARSEVQGDDVGISCVGFTFNVAMDALRGAPVLAGRSIHHMVEFKRQWYIEGDRDRRGLVHALTHSGIGRSVPLEEARPGDFAQFWRSNGSGHAVVIIDLVRRDGRIVGLEYISSQKSTNGIARKIEQFSDAGGDIDRARCHVARLNVRRR